MRKFIIYSLRKNQWFKENMCGYTDDKHEAGRYTPDEAIEAVAGCQAHHSDLPELAVMYEPRD